VALRASARGGSRRSQQASALCAGAHTEADERDYDGINRAFLSRGYVVTPDHEDWGMSGVLLARYQQRYGAVEPRDHINDILIALCAVKANAELVTENATNMERWQRMLRRAGKRLAILAVSREEYRAPTS